MDDFTPEQLDFLRQFADHYRLGRRVMCGFAHAMAFLGAAAAVLMAYLTMKGIPK